MANYILEAAYKNCLKWLMHCNIKTFIAGIFQSKEIHLCVLDTQITSLLHGNGTPDAHFLLSLLNQGSE